MQKILVLLTAVLLVGLLSIASAQPQDPEDTSLDQKQKVEDLVQASYNAHPGAFLLKDLSDPDPNQKNGFRIVFVHKDKRYTLDHNWWGNGIHVSVRPDGTYDHKLVDAFADSDSDGTADWGTNGSDKIFYAPEFDEAFPEGRGLQHQSYWQGIYNQALLAWQETLQD